MHFHIAATYLKQFSNDPSKGRKSIVRVYNKKKKIEQELKVESIGINKSAFSNQTEKFHSFLESKYHNVVDLISLKEPKQVSDEVVKETLMVIFDFILRSKEIYDKIIQIYSKLPLLVKVHGDNPWHTSDIIPRLYFELIQRRKYPAGIKSFNKDVFITCDNPVIVDRLLPYGSLYLLPIDRRHIFCLGYYKEPSGFNYFEEYIKNCIIFPEKINKQLKNQANTFIIL